MRTFWLPVMLVLDGCSNVGTPLPQLTPEINATLRPMPLLLAPGDTLSVRFPNKSQWDHQTTVGADGRAMFHAIDSMEVAGLTIDELNKRLREAYLAKLTVPEVSVFVTTRAARNVIVMGEVSRPGAIPIEGRMSLLDAIGRAGGPIKTTAYLEHTLLIRWFPEENRQVVWNIDACVENWGGPIPLLLQPYDVVFIPNKPIDRVDTFVDQYIRQMLPFPGVNPTTVFVASP
ncbi:MAG: polysaccharide biosynthesis/export family protein [Planctomycetota bacterium]